MRESKFRGKRIDNDKWVYGDLIHCYGADAGRIFIKTLRGRNDTSKILYQIQRLR